MENYERHIVKAEQEARVALKALDVLPDNTSRTLFIVNNNNQLIGSLTDGDIRRGLLNGLEISYSVELFMNTEFKFIKDSNDNIELIKEYKKAYINLIPVIDDDGHLIRILDLKNTQALLPLAALIMAGGRGERLKPLTDNIPKPMLIVGKKPIIEYNIDRLIAFGIRDIYISVKYLKEQIIEYFGDGSKKGINIYYIEENEPLGTLGAISYINEIPHEDILVMNSDLLTNIDFEDFYNFYKEKNAGMALASIPYQVNIPYGVLQTNAHEVSSVIEKPTYTYYSNGGIYIFKFDFKKYCTRGTFFNATDLIDKIIECSDLRLVHYPLLGYWLDIGKHQDFLKAQEDIKHLQF